LNTKCADIFFLHGKDIQKGGGLETDLKGKMQKINK